MNIYLFFYKGDYDGPNIMIIYIHKPNMAQVVDVKLLFFKQLSEDEIALAIKIHSFPQWFVDIWINEPLRMGFKIVQIKNEPKLYILYRYPGCYGVQVAFECEAEQMTDDGSGMYRVMDEIVDEAKRFDQADIESIPSSELGIY